MLNRALIGALDGATARNQLVQPRWLWIQNLDAVTAFTVTALPWVIDRH